MISATLHNVSAASRPTSRIRSISAGVLISMALVRKYMLALAKGEVPRGLLGLPSRRFTRRERLVRNSSATLKDAEFFVQVLHDSARSTVEQRCGTVGPRD